MQSHNTAKLIGLTFAKLERLSFQMRNLCFYFALLISCAAIVYGQPQKSQQKPTPTDLNAVGTGLRGEYFNNTLLSGIPAATKLDAAIDFDWAGNSPAPGIGNDNFSVRWLGTIKAPVTANYRFSTVSDDGVRLWINNRLVIDNWTAHGATTDISETIKLTRGQSYDIKLEYFEQGGDAVIKLLWSRLPGQPTAAIIPGANLFPPSGVGSGNPVLYIAQMRPEGSVLTNGSGVSSLVLSSDERSAAIRFNYSNLSSPVIAAHTHGPSNPGENGPILFDFDKAPQLPDGSFLWTFAPLPNLSVAQIVAAIKTGRIYINIHTANFPAGEIRGHYGRVNGSTAFTAPPAVPPVAPGPASTQDAARFLTQATFGVTPGELTRVQRIGFERYLNEQFNAPTTAHLAYLDQAEQAGENVYVNSTMEAFWQKAVTGNDQLRQRVAFALSEIFVVSANSSALGIEPFALSSYMDTLQNNSFGNFRTILNDVTLHPAMGLYLDMLKNDKENPATGRIPNENYAREINQLFSVGLYKLHPDGSLILDERGLPIPTYNQDVVVGFAHVFTGWSWGGIPTDDGGWHWPPSPNDQNHRGWRLPMQPWENHHSTGTKLLLNGVTLPAGQTARQDLNQALDNIFYHPNVAPFISRQLIQRLVTSNPSPGYIYRVAQVFDNNGAGVRGDMKAVIRAILLDYEARSPNAYTQPGYGKQREPILRFSALLRTFDARAQTGKFRLWNLEDPIYSLGQNPLRAPSVFNFFEPNYVHPGRISNAGLYAPEFQITTETQIVGSTNHLTHQILYGHSDNENRIKLNLTQYLPLATTPDQLVDRLNILLMSGQMSAAMKQIVVQAVARVPADQAEERLKVAIQLIATSPQFAIQK